MRHNLRTVARAVLTLMVGVAAAVSLSAALAPAAGADTGTSAAGVAAVRAAGGVDSKGYCTPKAITNNECFHRTSTRYTNANCKKLRDELNYSGVAFCQGVPPAGGQVIVAYTPACKNSEYIEDCRRRLGTKPVVMQPGGHW